MWVKELVITDYSLSAIIMKTQSNARKGHLVNQAGNWAKLLIWFD